MMAPEKPQREPGRCPRCGDESLPERATGERNALCDDCLGEHLDMTDD